LSALIDTSFTPSQVTSFCEPILRVVLAAPTLLYPDDKRIVLDYALQDTCKALEKLPSHMLAEAAPDPNGYGSEQVSLGALLKEAHTFAYGRKTPEPVWS
jgi:hypothetical protein